MLARGNRTGLTFGQSGNPNPGGMHFISDIQTNEQGGNRLYQTGGGQRTDVNRANAQLLHQFNHLWSGVFIPTDQYITVNLGVDIT